MSALQAPLISVLLLAGVRRVSLGGVQKRPGWRERAIGNAGRVGGREAGAASFARVRARCFVLPSHVRLPGPNGAGGG